MTGSLYYAKVQHIHLKTDPPMVNSSLSVTVTKPDMEKVKKFQLAELLGFIISAKKCVILSILEIASISLESFRILPRNMAGL